MEIKNIFSLGELFAEVQLQNIYGDGKTFVDCTPKENFSCILERYEEQKNNPGFDLKAFVHEYFIEPEKISSKYESDVGRPLEKHVEMLWDVLSREPAAVFDSLVFLPHPYIVSGKSITGTAILPCLACRFQIALI